MHSISVQHKLHCSYINFSYMHSISVQHKLHCSYINLSYMHSISVQHKLHCSYINLSYMHSISVTPASEPKVTNPDEVHETIRRLKVGKAPGRNSIPNRTLKHPPQRAVSLLVRIFNAILLTHHFPSLWKNARVTSILKPGKDPPLPSSC